MKAEVGLGWLVFLAAVHVGAGERDASASVSQRLDWRHVLAQTAEVYASCDSYRDEGLLTDLFTTQECVMTVQIRFSTAFVRPDRFRFAYAIERPLFLPSLIWRNGRDLRFWWPGKEESPPNLGLAIASATGVSGGAAHNVPALLMPDEVPGRRLLDFDEVDAIGIEVVSGRTCYRLEGRWAGRLMRIWIDAESLLLRQVEQEWWSPDSESVRTIVYRPEMNQILRPRDLAFDPPRPKAEEDGHE